MRANYGVVSVNTFGKDKWGIVGLHYAEKKISYEFDRSEMQLSTVKHMWQISALANAFWGSFH